MISKVNLHFRTSPLDQHRTLGVVDVEHAGPHLAPYQEITFCRLGRHVTAHVTAIRQAADRLPHVYADAVQADEVRAEAELESAS